MCLAHRSYVPVLYMSDVSSCTQWLPVALQCFRESIVIIFINLKGRILKSLVEWLSVFCVASQVLLWVNSVRFDFCLKIALLVD